MTNVPRQPYFQDEGVAYAKLESIVWPNGPVCPHCGLLGRMKTMGGTTTRSGLYKCYGCRKQSRVTVGTVFEKSHVKLHVWLQAMFLLCSGKKDISSNQLSRSLGVTAKTAWFMSRRLHEAMATGGALPPMGGEGATRALGWDEDEAMFNAKLATLVRPIWISNKREANQNMERSVPKAPSRITEADLVVPTLRLAARRLGGFISTSELKTELQAIFSPVGKDDEIALNRADTYFTQKVRNLVSHKASNFIASGYAEHDPDRRGIVITDEGRGLLRAIGYKA
jgi:transposase-like protein